MSAKNSFGTAGVRRALFLALGVLTLIVSACGTGAGAASSPVATTTVDLPPSYRLVPTAIVVPVGATVTWTNRDNFTHNVAFDGAEPLQMVPGQSVSRAFEAPGTYTYVCSLHPKDMKGTVLIDGT
jgi:plastocyanin